jgi:pteridine reductase
MELAGRLALVTGAGIRLGRALAEGLAGQGMRLALHYRQHEAQARACAAAIEAAAASPPTAWARCFYADLARPESAAELVREVEASMGGLDVLALSAAIYPQEPLDRISPEALEETLRINMITPFLLAKEAGLRMKERGRGQILALLDWSLDRPYPDRLPYTMAKAGLRAGILGLARALAPEVQVNAIAPGAVLLPEGTPSDLRERIIAATPLRRLGSPEDVVEAALYLLRSSYATGSVLTVDGGRTIVS